MQMMRMIGSVCLLIVTVLFSNNLFGNTLLSAELSKQQVPAPLKPWIAWVEKDLDFLACPMTEGAQPTDRDSRICAWPDELNIEINRTRGQFKQNWQVYRESWVPLPGDTQSWPVIQINGRAAQVRNNDGRPSVWLTAGRYSISGFWKWDTQPEMIAVPNISRRIHLNLNQQRIHFPAFDGKNLLLGYRDVNGAAEVNEVELDVYRLLSDGQPMTLETRISLISAGRMREVNLGRVLPDGFQLANIESDVPAVLNSAGELIVQVQSDWYDITLTAHAAQTLVEFKRPSTSDIWPKQEIWSYVNDQKLRMTELDGPKVFDPSRTDIPDEWRSYPTYVVEAEQLVNINQTQRGIDTGSINQFSLNRTLWLDFGGEEFRFIDEITGAMRDQWHLTMLPGYQLEYANEQENPLLITDYGGQMGIELRYPKTEVEAGGLVARDGLERVSGWQHPLTSATWSINLPPGYRLLHVSNNDAHSGWSRQWGVWDFFWIAFISAIAWRTFSMFSGVATAVTLALCFHETGAPLISFSHLVVVLALLSRAKFSVRWQQTLRNVYLTFAAVLFAYHGGWFFAEQIKLTLHPQLEQANVFAGYRTEYKVQDGLEPAVYEAETFSDVSSMLEDDEEETIIITGSRVKVDERVQKYSSDRQLQTGTGKPAWSWNRYRVNWPEPVTSEQTTSLWIAPPWMTKIWRLLSGLSLLLVIGWLVITEWRDTFKNWRSWLPQGTALLLFTMCSVFTQPVLANETTSNFDGSFPNQGLLDQLRDALYQPPTCSPDCVAINRLVFKQSAAPNGLELELTVDAFADTAFPIPMSDDVAIRTIQLNGQPLPWSARREGYDWVFVPTGRHLLRLSGVIREQDSLVFQFNKHAVRIENQTEQWEMEGVVNGALYSDELTLLKRLTQSSADNETTLTTTTIAPQVVLRRLFLFSEQQSVDSTVFRLAPTKGSINVTLPLYSWEKITSPGVRVEQGQIALQIPPGEDEYEWFSILPDISELQLTALEIPNVYEEWIFRIAHDYQFSFAGIPAAWPQYFDDDDLWQFRFVPQQGEQLALDISRAQAVKGPSQAFDRLEFDVTSGTRSVEFQLKADYRATLGSNGAIIVGEGSRLTAEIDGEPSRLKISEGTIGYPVLPGEHSLNFNWFADQSFGLSAQLPAIDIQVPTANLSINWQVPRDRWVIWTSGPSIGPAIIYWGELVVFLLLAWLISRTRLLPIPAHHWLLLGLGLGLQSWWVLVVTTAWLIGVHHYPRMKSSLARAPYNVSQVIQAVFSAGVVVALIAAIPISLLQSPDMGIVGNGSSGTMLRWYADNTSGPLPSVAVYSLPLWVYRLLTLAWSLWLAFALLGWVKNAWTALSEGGLIKGRDRVDVAKSSETD